MVLQLFIGLMLLASATLLVTQGRRRRIWSVLLLGGVACLSYLFIDNLNQSVGSNFIYQWLPYDILKAEFSISSSKGIQEMLVPLMLLLGGLVYLNTIYPDEQHSLRLNTLLILNFVGLILLFSSHDFLQLMFASCIFSLVSFYLPDLMLPKKNMMIFNFLAEISIFMALAIVYGKIDSVRLIDLSKFVSRGAHKDLVSALLIFAIGCKCGLFLLNGHYFSLKHVSINRIASILIFSSPLSGLILLSKLRVVLDASEFSSYVVSYWCGLSIIINLGISIFNNDLRIKLIALSLSLYSYTASIIFDDSQILYTVIPVILTSLFLIILFFQVIDKSALPETNVSRLGGLWYYNKFDLLLIMVIILGLTSELLLYPVNMITNILVSFFVVSLALIVKMVYFGKSKQTNNPNISFLYWLPIIGICSFIVYILKSWTNVDFYKINSLIFAVLALIPCKIFIKVGTSSVWQNDILTKFYETLIVSPLKFLGRILWLAFDVVVIEKSIIGSVSMITSSIVSGLHKLQEIRLLNFLLGLITGIILLSIYLGVYIHE